MEVIPISPETDRLRETFIRLLFGQNEGYVCIAYAERGKRESFREEYFKYPIDVPEILNLLNKVTNGHNVWYCPHLFKVKKRAKENVSITPCAWSDLDTCQPEELLVEPTFLVESSPGRYQALWSFDREVAPDDAEDLSRRIAYHHSDSGADRSGWDLTQLLRVPFTYNYKYQSTPAIKTLDANRKKYRLSDFGSYPQVEAFRHLDIPLPSDEDVPQDANAVLQEARLRLNPMIWKLYQDTPDKDWSGALWQLMMLLFEASFTREEVLAIVREAGCNKWARDNQSQEQLWKDICRAWNKFEHNTNLILPKNDVEPDLVTDEERRQVEASESFIERYMTWAKSLGDAAPQYHQAGAFTVLSSLLAGTVRLPTSFGMLVPNLWFMILADTTLTRKSTAMDIAMDLVMEVDTDIVLATDGSLEGLLTSLSTRPGQPSVFLRDEFSGLLEMITKKDYYAGMPELLTKLYDGKMQKRVLRKEVIEVRDPVLLIFAGGIKNRITSLLSYEQVSSGFMPRFVFITAESDITRVKPLGPPTDFTDNNRAAILNEITDLKKHYSQKQTLVVQQAKTSFEEQRRWDAKMTPEAWYRYNQLETQMLDLGLQSERSDIMMPTYDRLSKSILKAATLLAASRQHTETVLVEEEDIVRAIVYGENWKMYVREVMNSVGKSQNERHLDTILNAIIRSPGVSRSKLMQSYHLSARDTDFIFQTLEQRGMITRQKAGRTEVLFATQPG